MVRREGSWFARDCAMVRKHHGSPTRDIDNNDKNSGNDISLGTIAHSIDDNLHRFSAATNRPSNLSDAAFANQRSQSESHRPTASTESKVSDILIQSPYPTSYLDILTRHPPQTP